MDREAVIVPTELEAELFAALLAAARASGRQTILRVAGGWVRDKLIGRDSHDIDIAVDDCTGVDFAVAVHEHLKAAGVDVGSLGKIQANPDQSKHLETATMRVLGLQIDFVNLRSEEYADSSRIPTIAIGTPEQDAMRRDLTINALFYRLDTREVEDWTGRGLQDLRQGLVRTPLDPLTTFLDDPLRVLRAVRFATRYGFSVAADLAAAAAAPSVQAALAAKISRERIGTELEGALHGPRPVGAMLLAGRLGLYPAVLSPRCEPDAVARGEGTVDRPASECVVAVASVLAALSGVAEPPMPGVSESSETIPEAAAAGGRAGIAQSSQWAEACPAWLALAAALLPVRSATVPLKRGKRESAARHVAVASLKWRTATSAEVAQVVDLSVMGDELVFSGEVPPLRAGRFVREAGALWRAVLVLAGAAKVARAECTTVEAARGVAAFAQQVTDWGLSDVWQEKPVLNGKELIGCGVPKGKGIGVATQLVLDWQIENRGGTAEACADYIRSLPQSAFAVQG